MGLSSQIRRSLAGYLAVLALTALASGPAIGQETEAAPSADPATEETLPSQAPEPVTYGEIQALIEDMQARLSNIDSLSKNADKALDSLDTQVDEAIDKLGTRDEENVALRDRAVGLSTELDSLASTHDELAAALARTENERQSVEEILQGEIDVLAEQLAAERTTVEQLEASATDLARLLDAAATDRDRLDGELVVASRSLEEKEALASDQALELASLRNDVETLREVRTELEAQVAALALDLQGARTALRTERDLADGLNATLDRSRSSLLQERERNESLLSQLGEIRDRSKALEARLAEEAERTVLAQKDVAARDTRIEGLVERVARAETEAADQRQAAIDSRDRVSLLNQQLAELRNQLIQLNLALESSEEKNRDQQVQIVNLGTRLNQALATKVQELASYRSEFFGRLREVLGSRSDVQIVGDRFVIQSEVLFETGSAELGPDGQVQLEDMAATLNTISGSIPPGVDWILRVDGHTDERPIQTEQFPSNWELSAARALSVVNFLIDQNVAPNRLVAAGFGQFHPLDARNDEIAFRRNRRIEFKLTQR